MSRVQRVIPWGKRLGFLTCLSQFLSFGQVNFNSPLIKNGIIPKVTEDFCEGSLLRKDLLFNLGVLVSLWLNCY